ncbi:DUF262 domain-containing protein [Microbacterium sp. zg.Y909]|uniref:DUF262 domain-containing protein n=1 Tax=Microbacterium sp. zg.Y909 TaxID=2969413 RepID=UPI00214C7773|nr:DUF262 domain-containing protein [Microbacterium sp. zg.Y909]MCR2826612.1 DUF262 domain-containing protein [Microbacterium sp. zg.Y909]
MPTLEEEIEAGRREIFTDSYSMSIGEITNLYRDAEIDVHPEFQRVFRWDDLQKSRLVESILLGIPLPSIFVAQSENGSWDVVDGVQRLSTILQFQGILKDDEGNLMPPISLEGTRLLPSLAGKRWDDPDEGISLTSAQRLDFKRAKLDLKIVKRESSADSKYDLFQRLNSYGSQATQQEVRSCMLIGTNRDFYTWLAGLATDANFLSTVALSERLIGEQYHLELALRFVIFRRFPADQISTIGNLGEFVTNEAMRMALAKDFEYDAEAAAFRKTFEFLNETSGDLSFKRWNEARQRFGGPFLNTSFEVIAMGLGHNIDRFASVSEVDPTAKAKEFWTSDDYGAGFATGVRADARMAKSIPLGRQLFSA